jgi:hypothetical protein
MDCIDGKNRKLESTATYPIFTVNIEKASSQIWPEICYALKNGIIFDIYKWVP